MNFKFLKKNKIIKIFIFLFFVFPSFSFSAFTLSGTTITQTGTDNTASAITALSAISGVTTQADQNYTRINIPYKLNVTGTLTTDKGVGFTFSRSGQFANEVIITGSWTYKEERNENGFDDYYQLPPMIFTQDQISGFNGTTRNAIYLNGGTMDFAKLEIIGDGGQYWNGGSLKLRQVVFNAQNLASNADTQFTSQGGNPTIDIIGLKVLGGRVFFSSGTFTNFSGFEPIYMQRGIGTRINQFVVEDFIGGQGNIADVSAWQNQPYSFNNPNIGSDLSYAPWLAGNNNSDARISVTSDLKIIAVDENNNAVNGFKTYYADNTTNAPTDYTTQNIYNGTATGNELAFKVVLGALNLQNGATGGFIKRSASQTNDLYSFPLLSYNNQITQTASFDLKGTGEKVFNIVMLRDANITESNQATTVAYTEIETPQKFYDRAKAFLVDNYAGETATIVSRVGDTINSGANNVVVDATATTAFAYDGTTITIAASTFTGNIASTTGTVTFVNGAQISGVSTDVNSNSALTISGLTTGQTANVYASATDANTSTNPIETLTANGNGEALYKYNADNVIVFIKAETNATFTQGAIRQYEKVSGVDNTLNMAVGGSLASIESTLNILRDQTQNTVYIDANYTGTDESGSATTPFNTLAEAKTYAENRKVKSITFLSNYTLDSTVSGYTISSPNYAKIDLNNQQAGDAMFLNIEITGQMNGIANSENTIFESVQDIDGTHRNPVLEGINTIASSSDVELINPTSGHTGGTNTVIDLNSKSAVQLGVREFSGSLEIRNSTATNNSITVAGSEYSLSLPASNTAGTIQLQGLGNLENQSAMTIVSQILQPQTLENIWNKVKQIFVSLFI